MNDLYTSWGEVEQNLVKFPVTTKLVSEENTRRRRSVNANTDGSQNAPDSSEKMDSVARKVSGKDLGLAVMNSSITEVTVSGNVTGILIPNSAKVVVRVLAALVKRGAELDQDFKFLKWNSVSL
jgi:hypothetical protein